MRKDSAFALMAALIVGCEEGTPSGVGVAIDQVPAHIMKVAGEKLPGVKFEQAWKTHDGNFEVRGKGRNGKVRDIQVKPNGDVIEVD